MKGLYVLMQKYPIVQGFIICVVTYVTSFTIIIPLIFGLILCSPYEMVVSLFFNPQSNQALAYKVEVLLVCLLVISLVLNALYKEKRSVPVYFWMMLIFQLSLIETLGFYYHWSKLGYRNDGQLFFGFYDSFQDSSIVFIPFYSVQWVFDKIPFHRWVYGKSLTKEVQQIKFEEKVEQLIRIHKDDSEEKLKEILTNEGWTLEAKEAAKQILKIKE